jgi:uncharacterized protein
MTALSKAVGLGVAALGLGAAGIGWALVEARQYILREVTVPVLPAGHPEVRVLHLSDLHLTTRLTSLAAWVRDLDRLEPDLVVSTGDSWAQAEALPVLLDALEPHLERPGVFVFGSNDYFAPRPKNPARYLLPDARTAVTAEQALPWHLLRDRFTDAGWLDLTNRRDSLDLAGLRVDLVGTDDAHLDLDRMPSPASDRGDLRLGVTHAPYQRVLDAFLADGVDLAFAGHTHGGQLAVPGVGALTTNCDLDTSRAKGLHGWPGDRPDQGGAMWLHVSAGLGTSPYAPVRFSCRPEATLLHLVPAPTSR